MSPLCDYLGSYHEPITAYPTSGHKNVTLIPSASPISSPSSDLHRLTTHLTTRQPEPLQDTLDGYVNKKSLAANINLPYSRAHLDAIQNDLLAPLGAQSYVPGCEPRDVALF
ncbi:MAG: hypothetical protein Q7R76_01385 [Candidatus Woesearchaeota archaeon]|nr:hypothetical protein [Candidatus Woesearchaeota archaeon]